MGWRLHQTHRWPVPAKVGTGHYGAWADAVREKDARFDPIGFKRYELQVEVVERPEIADLPTLLAWATRLLNELHIIPAGCVMVGATIWKNDGAPDMVRVTIWDKT